MNSCKDCIHAQADLSSIRYVRLAGYKIPSDIMIVACDKHLALFEKTYPMLKFETLEQVREYSKK